jgi:predicted transcriptional regulator
MTWDKDREAALLAAVGDARPVSQEAVAKAAAELEVSTRSASAKLRKMGEEVEKVGARASVFSDGETAALAEFLSNSPGEFTYGEIAEKFAGGKFSAKQIQGKVLSLELTGAVKPTPKPETKKTYTDEEETVFVKLAKAGAYLEDIADKLGKTVQSVRGKALSLTRTDTLKDIPPQRDKVSKVDAFEALGDVSELTVAQIAEKLGKTERGIKTILTRRGKSCADYKAKKKAVAA